MEPTVLYEAELAMVNGMKRSIAGLVRATVAALKDRMIVPWEGIDIGGQGIRFALQLNTLLQTLLPESAKRLFYVLEHGNFTLAESGYESELGMVNAMKRSIAVLVRMAVEALDDGTFKLSEIMGIGGQVIQFALQLVMLLQTLMPESAQRLLYVLENGDFTLPESA